MRNIVSFRPIWLVLLLALCACGAGRGNSVVPVQAANPHSPHALNLRVCVRAGGQQTSCRLQTLPLLGMQTSDPQLGDILDRTAISHPWMAERFAQLLEQLPGDLRLLARSLTAVVIASDVRPSFYWRRTGAVYLDPAGLWLTNAEKQSIDKAPDFRSGFGQALAFRIFSRYVQGNSYAWRSYSLDDDEERSLDDIAQPMARLLYHELAHANDFFPVTTHGELNSEDTVDAAGQALAAQRISTALEGNFPLGSELMRDLAQVNFAGIPASDAQLALSPAEVGEAFGPDRANDDYGYFTQFEDLAMLFEETMMRLHFDVERDVAVTDVPHSDNPTANDYRVSWGQRGRLGAQQVRDRAEFAAQRVLPERDFQPFFAALPPPRQLREGAGWIDNLNPNGDSAKQATGKATADETRGRDLVLD